MLQIETAAGPEVQELRNVMRAKTWDLRNTASEEKAAAAKHFPLKLLQSMRLVHTSDTMVKGMSRKYLSWVRQLYGHLGRNKMRKDDGSDAAIPTAQLTLRQQPLETPAVGVLFRP